MLHPFRLPLAPVLVLAGLLSAPGAARAAQSYDACEGRFIDSLPVTINTQGVWCLRKDLATAITSGGAITIEANNVTVDCNDFKLGGLAAGPGTNAGGIVVHDRLNATVRNCNIRGFHSGVYIDGTSRAKTGGHVIENNRFNNNTRYGIYVVGDGSVIEHNKVVDTGGSTTATGAAVAISVMYDGDILGNLVSNVAAVADGSGNANAYGIQLAYGVGSIAHNRVRGLSVQGSGLAIGVMAFNSTLERQSVHDNDLAGPGVGWGVYCYLAQAVAHGNTIGGFATPLASCTDGGNFVGP